jgi:hypothetical protein
MRAFNDFRAISKTFYACRVLKAQMALDADKFQLGHQHTPMLIELTR